MPFQPDPTLPDLARLKSQLLTSGVQQSNNSLWQVINQLIDALQNVNSGLNSGEVGGGANPDASYITVDNELADLPGSSQLLPGFGIDIDTSVPGEVTINTSGYWAPLSDGDLVEAEIIFADGEVIMVFCPDV
ncbi:MAG: hypothetical protein ABWY25_10895 [Paenisporosarcina sp.]